MPKHDNNTEKLIGCTRKSSQLHRYMKHSVRNFVCHVDEVWGCHLFANDVIINLKIYQLKTGQGLIKNKESLYMYTVGFLTMKLLSMPFHPYTSPFLTFFSWICIHVTINSKVLHVHVHTPEY